MPPCATAHISLTIQSTVQVVIKMNTILLLLLGYFYVHASDVKHRNTVIRNIIGGSSVSKNHEHIYQVSLTYRGDHFCGGSILTPSKVVTAASCISKFSTNQIAVMAGITNVTEHGQWYALKALYIHPLYEENHFTNDIGILVPHLNIKFGPRVGPIPICRNTLESRSVCTATGWGPDHVNGKSLSILREVNVTLLSGEDCIKTQPENYLGINPKVQVCTIHEEKGISSGDAGGPLIYQGELVGIASLRSDCQTYHLDVFTKVSAYVKWIKSIKTD